LCGSMFRVSSLAIRWSRVGTRRNFQQRTHSSMAAPPEATKDSASVPVRMMVFDFDQTLSCTHVFYALSGRGTRGVSVPPPYTVSEEGQLCRIEELNKWTFKQDGGLSQAMFGGRKRVIEVQETLQSLQTSGVELIICTKGLVGTINKILDDLDMARYFSDVYGRTADAYGQAPYDKTVALPDHLRHFLGRPEQDRWRSKRNLVSELMAERGLHKEQAVLVEDDPEEIKSAKDVCLTVFVKEAAGLQTEHLTELKNLALHGYVSPAPASRAEAPARPENRGCTIL